jgi:hypothetical protein
MAKSWHQSVQIPLKFEFIPSRYEWRDGDGELLVRSKHKAQADCRRENPRQLRDEFLRVTADKANILPFLNRWGEWDGTERVRVSDFARLQTSVNEGLTATAAAKWFHHVLPSEWEKSSGLSLHPFGSDVFTLAVDMQENYPHVWVKTDKCREAILMSVTIDKLRGVRFAHCARPDCPNPPYEMTSDHERMYCSQYCAHLESIRRNAKKKKSRQKKGGK